MILTGAGFARGGCIHEENNERCIVLEGRITHFIYHGDTYTYNILGAGEITSIPKGKPHYYISDSDSVVLEIGATIKEKQTKHPETRQIVDDLNKMTMEKVKQYVSTADNTVPQ